MINLTTANNALKTVYLDVLDNMLNVSVNPLFSKIKKTSEGVYGKEIKVLAPYGLNGGICATGETSELPQVSSNNYINLTTTLKNLYGVLEISDKAVRASQNSVGAFVNLLNDEMESLIRASAFNLSRMLYSDGQGYIAQILSKNSNTEFVVDTTAGIYEGMIIDIFDHGNGYYDENAFGLTVLSVDRTRNIVVAKGKKDCIFNVAESTYVFTVQESLRHEITGINALFNDDITKLYGLEKSAYSFMKGALNTVVGDGACDEMEIVKAMDFAEEVGGSKINYIACSSDVRRMYQNLLKEHGRNVQMVDIGNGFKGIDFYGVPMISDRFVEKDAMYLLDTDAFTLHQMCDWEWLTDDNGNVLSQKPGYATYTATLVKYADLLCSRPLGQAKFKNITSIV